MPLDRAALLAAFIPTDTVALPSGAGDVVVRGLTRMQAVEMNRRIKAGEFDEIDAEIAACALGMVQPKLTEDDVRAWREVAVAADVQAVAQRISELSNLDEHGGKGPTSSSRRTRS